MDQKEDQLYFVTARGWEDLSELMKSYESFEIPVTVDQIAQFLHQEGAARDFAAYYALYQKYGMDYGIRELLAGELSEEEYQQKTAMAAGGGFEERFTVVNLVMEQLQEEFRRYEWEDETVTRLHQLLKQVLENISEASIHEFISGSWRALETKEGTGLISAKERRKERFVLMRLEEMELSVKQQHLRENGELRAHIEKLFEADVEHRAAVVRRLQEKLTRAFDWLLACFRDGQEMVLFVSSLTRSPMTMDYIARHGCPAYLKYSQALLFRQRESELKAACQELLKETAKDPEAL